MYVCMYICGCCSTRNSVKKLLSGKPSKESNNQTDGTTEKDDLETKF